MHHSLKPCNLSEPLLKQCILDVCMPCMLVCFLCFQKGSRSEIKETLPHLAKTINRSSLAFRFQARCRISGKRSKGCSKETVGPQCFCSVCSECKFTRSKICYMKRFTGHRLYRAWKKDYPKPTITQFSLYDFLDWWHTCRLQPSLCYAVVRCGTYIQLHVKKDPQKNSTDARMSTTHAEKVCFVCGPRCLLN